jgi:nucleoid-associated protein YgaU
MTPSDEPTDRLVEESRGEAAEDVDEPAREEPAVRETAQRTVTVKNGDTLGHISLRAYGTTRHWKKIAEANNVTPRNIHPNMVLVIPEVAGAGGGSGDLEASSSGARPSCGCAYTVRRGDTIQSIAKAAYGSIERWPDIWFENMERISNPDELASGVEISIPR